MKKTILILFALFAFTAMAQTAFNGHDSIVSLVNDHTDSVLSLAKDSINATVNTTSESTNDNISFGWKLIGGILLVAEVVLRVIPTKNGMTILGLIEWLHSKIPNNVKKEKKD